jgi:hypothetical protein
MGYAKEKWGNKRGGCEIGDRLRKSRGNKGWGAMGDMLRRSRGNKGGDRGHGKERYRGK